MKQMIFLVHGIGDTKPGWSAPVQGIIREKYEQYAALAAQPFDDGFVFREINYNGIFENLREQWAQQAAPVMEPIKKALGSACGGVMEAVDDMGSKDQFAYTHMLDVILYRFLPTARDAVKVRVASQIVDALRERQKTDRETPRWTVVAHSMGTAVIHDTLDAVYKTAVPGAGERLSTSDTRAKLVMMVSNTSRLLEDKVKAYESYVKPSYQLRPDAVCYQYLTVCHRLDAVGRIRPFDPPPSGWIDQNTADHRCYAPVRVSHMIPDSLAQSPLNIHDLGYYLENPKVHIPLFRKLFYDTIIGEDEAAVQQNLFEQNNDSQLFDRALAAIDKMMPADEKDWGQVAKSLGSFFHSINQ